MMNVTPGTIKSKVIKITMNTRNHKGLRVLGDVMLRKKSPSFLIILFGVSYVYWVLSDFFSSIIIICGDGEIRTLGAL